MLPADTLHVTAVLVVPNAKAENGWNVPIGTVAVVGEIETDTWGFVMLVALPLPLPPPQPSDAQQSVAIARMAAKRKYVSCPFAKVDMTRPRSLEKPAARLAKNLKHPYRVQRFGPWSSRVTVTTAGDLLSIVPWKYA
jgi:hypothetical protein